MVVFGARPRLHFAVIDDDLFSVAESSEIGRHQPRCFQSSDLLAQRRNRQRSDSYTDHKNRSATNHIFHWDVSLGRVGADEQSSIWARVTLR
jgi:hypothetical protein